MLRLRVLGGLQLRDEAGAVVAVSGSRNQALLCVLAMGAGRPVADTRIFDALWPGDDGPNDPAGTVRTYVTRLRRIVGPGLVERVRNGYQLNLDTAEIDVVVFEHRVHEGLAALAENEPGRAVDELTSALALWNGPPWEALAGWADADSDTVRFEELHGQALEQRAAALLAQGRPAEAVRELFTLVAADPLREQRCALLMTALATTGRHAEALRAYEAFRRNLADELGLDPSPVLRSLQAAILDHQPLPPVGGHGVGGAAAAVVPSGLIPPTTGRVMSGKDGHPRSEPTNGTSVMTVLMVDLVQSTMLAERVGDDRAEALCDSALGEMRRVVEAAGGEVVKGLGDGFMAVFSSALAAIRAAREMRDVLAVVHTESPETPMIRVGLSSGEARHRTGDWYGRPVVEAVRLCAMAAPGEILVSDVTRRLVGTRGGESFGPLRQLMVKGFREPVGALEVLDPGAVDPSGIGPPPAGTVESDSHERHVLDLGSRPALAAVSNAPIVGRSVELERVAAVLDDVREGGAHTVLITGEPGVGKTRLVAAAAEKASALGFVIAYGSCEEELDAPFYPIVDALTPWLSTRVDRITGELQPAAGSIARLWPHLADRLPAAGAGAGEELRLQRWRLFESVAAILRSTAHDAPLVLIIDDLHWAESSTLLLLTHLVRQRIPRTAIVATARPAEIRGDPTVLLGDVSSGHTVDLIELSGLTRHAVADLVVATAGSPPPDSLTERLHDETDGNPFFLGAVLAHLEELGRLRAQDGTWISVDEIDSVGMPHQVRGVIARRLGRLRDAARRTLTVGAVIGTVFDDGTVRRTLQMGADEALDALEEAVRAGVIRETPDGRFSFAHALVRQAVLNGVSKARRAQLHWRIAADIESHSGRTITRVSEIAGHYAAGASAGEPSTVVRAAIAAGDDALCRLAFHEAAHHFRVALNALPSSNDDWQLHYHVATSLGRALDALGDPGGAEPLWLEAAELARRYRDPERLLAAVDGYAYMKPTLDQRGLVAPLEDVLALLPPEDSPTRATALAWRSRLFGLDETTATQMEAAAVAMARRTGDNVALANTLTNRVTWEGGGPNAAGMLAAAEELTALRRSIDKASPGVFGSVFSERDLSLALLRLGRRREAEERLDLAAEDAVHSGHDVVIHNVKMLQAALATASGQFSEAKRLAAEASALAHEVPLLKLAYGAQILAIRSEQGRIGEVIAALRQLDVVGIDLPAWQAMLAGVLADNGEHEAASAQLNRALEHDLFGYPRDDSAPLALRYLPEACRHLSDRQRAAELLPVLERWSGQILVATYGVSIEGAADRSVGHLLATLRRLDDADAAYTAAADLEEVAGLVPHLARTRHWQARLLLERNERSDRRRATDLLRTVADISSDLGMDRIHQQSVALRAG